MEDHNNAHKAPPSRATNALTTVSTIAPRGFDTAPELGFPEAVGVPDEGGNAVAENWEYGMTEPDSTGRDVNGG